MDSLIRNWKGAHKVTAMAIPRNRAQIAVGQQLSIVIWDMITGQTVLGPLQGHSGSIWALVFSPDGRTIVSGSADNTIRIWNMETGKTVIGPLKGHTEWVRSLAFSHDGHIIISGSDDGTIRLWDAHTGRIIDKPIREISRRFPSVAVLSVAVSPDNIQIVGAYSNSVIKVYDSTTRAILFECVGHELIVASVIFSPNGSRIVSASFDDTIRLWDAKTGEPIGSPLRGHTSSIRSIVFSPDGRHIFSGSDDLTVRVWDAETGAARGVPLRSHMAGVLAVRFTGDGSCLVSGSEDCTVKVWDAHVLGTYTRTSNSYSSLVRKAVDAAITSTSTLEEVVSHLGARGCADMTEQLNIATCSEYPISSGGFGDIYRCSLRAGTEVAIKTIRIHVGGDEDQKTLKYAAREIYTWSKCQHPHVQPLLGLVMFRGQIGMIARWESNGSLPQYLERYPEVDRCMMSTKVADGLLYLHESGVVHGDLKGANILVSWDGVPLLADFGNSTLQEYTLKFTSTSTKSNISSRWAAPELFKGTASSIPADIYALGMTILEIITGEVPWAGKPEHTIMFAIMFEKAYPNRPMMYIPEDSEHGEVLWSLLKWCWKFEPEERPSAGEVKASMDRVTKDGLKHKSEE